VLPSLIAAASDRRLASHERALMLWAVVSGALDVRDFRPLKVAVVQHEVRLRRDTTIRSLRHLCELGYLQCGVDTDSAPPQARLRRPRWYRLVYGAPEVEAPPEPPRVTASW
jgi:hypothetical protein